ncbi:MAG: hypothetical protein RL217_2133 [Pseudomonadota bacterium]|jgi:hypothetical protein
MAFTHFIRTAQRTLVALLLVVQVGFVNAEALWMALAHVPHQHLLETHTASDIQATPSQSQDALHHCDICHGHNAHFAVLPSMEQIETLEFQALPALKPLLSYTSLGLESLYRPPIFLS